MEISPHTTRLSSAQDRKAAKRIGKQHKERGDGASRTSALRSRRRALRGFLDCGNGSSTSIAGGPAAGEVG
jgi:hypothetical protein